MRTHEKIDLKSKTDEQNQNKQANTDKKTSDESEKKENTTFNYRSFIGVFALLFLFSLLDNKEKPRKQNERKNIEFILAEIEKGPEQAQVVIQR